MDLETNVVEFYFAEKPTRKALEAYRAAIADKASRNARNAFIWSLVATGSAIGLCLGIWPFFFPLVLGLAFWAFYRSEAKLCLKVMGDSYQRPVG